MAIRQSMNQAALQKFRRFEVFEDYSRYISYLERGYENTTNSRKEMYLCHRNYTHKWFRSARKIKNPFLDFKIGESHVCPDCIHRLVHLPRRPENFPETVVVPSTQGAYAMAQKTILEYVGAEDKNGIRQVGRWCYGCKGIYASKSFINDYCPGCAVTKQRTIRAVLRTKPPMIRGIEGPEGYEIDHAARPEEPSSWISHPDDLNLGRRKLSRWDR